MVIDVNTYSMRENKSRKSKAKKIQTNKQTNKQSNKNKTIKNKTFFSLQINSRF